MPFEAEVGHTVAGKYELLRLLGRGSMGEVPPPPLPEDTGHGRRLAGWLSLGVGGASLVGAGISLLVRQSALTDVNGPCGNHHHCDPSLQSTVDRGRVASTLTNVFGIIENFGVGTGVALIMTSPAPRQSALGPSWAA